MNWDAARGYVELLAYGGAVTFQTFDDTPAKRPALARIIHGRLRDCAAELERLQKAGAGVFVTVNETDFRGRSAHNIRALRALFADDDGGGVKSYPLPPCFTVHSARGPQPYWLLRDGEQLGRFADAQRQLAACLRTDPKICDLPRVMRLPGTWHQKGDPVMVELELGRVAKRYTIDEVLEAYPAPQLKTVRHSRPAAPRQTQRFNGEWWHHLRRPIAVGSRNAELFRLACRMRHDGVDEGRIEEALAELNQRLCVEPLADGEVKAIAHSVARY